MLRIQKKDYLIRWATVWGAMLMMTSGVLEGETKTVLAKAINICLECIGIG